MTDLKEIQETFDLLPEWEDRYAYLIDLGRNLSPLDDSKKVDDNLVRGCTSRVWMIFDVDEKGVLTIQADSDAHIVKGLIALVLAAYNGLNINEMSLVNMDKIFLNLGLSEHLSPNRRNGFFSMVNKIQGLGR